MRSWASGPRTAPDLIRGSPVAPGEHVLTLSLDHLQSGRGWVSIVSKVDPTIPRPTVVYQVKAPCVPGPWRMTATAAGSLWHQPFRFTKHSVTRAVSVRDCARK
jgi:hypothetical protein